MEYSPLYQKILTNFNNNNKLNCIFCKDEVFQVEWPGHLTLCCQLTVEYIKIINSPTQTINNINDNNKKLKIEKIENNYKQNLVSNCTLCTEPIRLHNYIHHTNQCISFIKNNFRQYLIDQIEYANIDNNSNTLNETINNSFIKNTTTTTTTTTTSNNRYKNNNNNNNNNNNDNDDNNNKGQKKESRCRELLVKKEPTSEVKKSNIDKNKNKKEQECIKIKELNDNRKMNFGHTKSQVNLQRVEICIFYNRCSDECGKPIRGKNKKLDLFSFVIGIGNEILKICRFSHFHSKDFYRLFYKDYYDKSIDIPNEIIDEKCIGIHCTGDTKNFNCTKHIYFSRNSISQIKFYFCSIYCLMDTIKSYDLEHLENFKKIMD
ncbi:hypothetical protein ACTFIW_011237 [Dictyostelium discoideum]